MDGYNVDSVKVFDEDNNSINSGNPFPVSIISGGSTPTSTSIEGGVVTVGTSAVEITFTGTTKSISLMSDSANTGVIWFGGDNIDSSGNNAFGKLTADRAVVIEFDDSSTALYCVSNTAGQKVYKLALT